ncbi:20314_t:CDS:1, partial [Gigaspora rosea]
MPVEYTVDHEDQMCTKFQAALLNRFSNVLASELDIFYVMGIIELFPFCIGDHQPH